MGLKIIRIFKSFKEITDKYEGSFQCSKDLNSSLEFIKKTWPDQQAKTLYHGKFRVVKDVNWNTWHEIELQVQAQNPVTKEVIKVIETIHIRIQYYKNVVTQITLELKVVDSKATFDEFKEAFEKKVPNAEIIANTASAPVEEETIDLSDKTMAESLKIFEDAIETFGSKVEMKTFVKIKAIRDEISKKIKNLDAKEKAAFMSSMSKIDTFVNAIDMQLSNPVMAASAASFAGTYVSQMLSEIAQMQAMC